jgi:DNA-binding LacI/PurR family transcriptional regulator
MTSMAERASRRATIRDVAQRAGVSKSLVSLAFVSPDSVGAQRRARIREAADDLGFRPNQVARSLNGSREDFVGILVADPRNPVLIDVVDAARAELARAGRAGLMTSAVQPADPRDPDPTDGGGRWSATSDARLDFDAVTMLADLRPSGVILVGSVPEMDRVLGQMGDARIVIASGRTSSPGDAATVRGDDTAGMRLVVDHLVERGHRRIGHAGGAGGPVAAGRAAAFAAAMEAHGLDPTLIAESDFSEESGARAADALLSRPEPPTAITALNDIAAIGVLTAVRRQGLLDRVAIAGYDATHLATLGPIDLTSVDPHSAEIGALAARALLAPRRERGEVLVAPSLRVRSSSAWTRSP